MGRDGWRGLQADRSGKVPRSFALKEAFHLDDIVHIERISCIRSTFMLRSFMLSASNMKIINMSHIIFNDAMYLWHGPGHSPSPPGDGHGSPAPPLWVGGVVVGGCDCL